jgi:hypothetical protein
MKKVALIKTDYEERRLQPTPAGHPQLATPQLATPSWPPPAGHPKGEPLSTGYSFLFKSGIVNVSNVRSLSLEESKQINEGHPESVSTQGVGLTSKPATKISMSNSTPHNIFNDGQTSRPVIPPRIGRSAPSRLGRFQGQTDSVEK